MVTPSDDSLIIGAGAVGLSLAYALAAEGLRVRLLEAGEPGREASWAGAGILPPAHKDSADPVERLTGYSNELHAKWAAQLREETGIDNGFWRCGGVYMARSEADAAELHAQVARWREQRISVHELTSGEISEAQPGLRPSPAPGAVFHLPDESQLRNPRHVQALVAACRRRGVMIENQQTVERLEVGGDRVTAVHTHTARFTAGNICLTAGCWSAGLAAQLNFYPAIKPVRGQIALVATPQPLVTHVINEGRRYLVPRADGRLLIGSTEEDAGFDKQPTVDGIQELLRFAETLVPAVRDAHFERGWAGLRPASADGLPYLGRVPRFANTFIAAGHYRHGLQLSPATAMVMSDLICGRDPQLDLRPFAPNR